MRGVYTLLIEFPENGKIKVGRLGEISLQKGFYAYVGSALGGLENRIGRHLRREKRLQWHIDYLTQRGIIRRVVLAETERRMECEIAKILAHHLPSIPNFGSTDCRCKSHLFFHQDMETLNELVTNAFKDVGLSEYRIIDMEDRGLTRL
mgnify:CR=1 FL=1